MLFKPVHLLTRETCFLSFFFFQWFALSFQMVMYSVCKKICLVVAKQKLSFVSGSKKELHSKLLKNSPVFALYIIK